jgi:VRR-NUC domain
MPRTSRGSVFQGAVTWTYFKNLPLLLAGNIYGDYRRFADWESREGNLSQSANERSLMRRNIERAVIDEIKSLHATNPKYVYTEDSQDQTIRRFGVKVSDLRAPYGRTPEGRGQILDGAELCTPEEYVARQYRSQNYDVIKTESAPFHALFGVFMWLLIQDPGDPLNRRVGFGKRDPLIQATASEQIWTLLPADFGTPAYSERRAEAIKEHFKILEDDLEWLFDYWLPYSDDLRQYLHAHRSQDVEIARKIVSILPGKAIRRILRYLLGDYWRRYLGWPDLLVFRTGEFFFAEVKSSSDKLSEDQKNWIAGNNKQLQLPFKLVKIHRRKN